MTRSACLTRRAFLRVGLGALVASNFSWPRIHAQSSTTLLAPVAQVKLPATTLRGLGTVHATGMWAQGTLAGVPNISLINLIEFSDPQNPQVVTLDISNVRGDCRDVDFYQNFLVCGLISANENRRVLIYDISNWKEPKLVSTVRATDYRSVHNVFVAGKVCFLPTIGGGRGELFMLDLSDPANPKDLGAVTFADRALENVHDVAVIGNRLYAAAWNTGFWIIDFENLDNPQQLRYKFVAQEIYGRGASHNIWPSPDGKLAFTTDEIKGEFVRIWDISNPSAIKFLSAYNAGPDSIPHDVFVDGAFAYIAHYAHGVRVLEYSNPREPKEVAAFDPYGGRSRFPSGFDGFWDVYPFDKKYVLASDMVSGLWILEKRGILLGR